MTDGKNKNYISLQNATKLCNYSQEYLSLRARQGKLKAIKLGRNWVTKKEWLEGYIKTAESYKEWLNGMINFRQPPANLPIGELKVFKDSKSFTVFLPALAFISAAVLIFAGTVFGKSVLQHVYSDILPHLSSGLAVANAKEAFSGTKELLAEYIKWVSGLIY
ncbi:MAG: hypothetical protein HYW70_00450 [Candidatus Nealsonbacteria bacterium]|nr:hypothetical protein [Candidatus Nealsonbacteria bacterium]